MVCKEDVLSWFKELESYQRIDVVYQVLNMCLPFEMRFLGSCLEEMGKHTYEDLRGPAITANDLDKLMKDTTLNNGLLDDSVRHRVLIYISLLSSRNYNVANWLYKALLRTERVREVLCNGASVRDNSLQCEFLLLFTMALHHPAFTFDQKLYFGEILTQFMKLRENKPNMFSSPPGFGYPKQPQTKSMNLEENAISVSVPLKTYTDTTVNQQPTAHAHIHHSLPIHPGQPAIDFLWSRPGFPCAPEVTPFPTPAPAISPLVSRTGSPSHSRSSSPHRTPHMPPPRGPTQPMDQPIISPVEMLSHSSLVTPVAPVYPQPPPLQQELRLPDDELNSLHDEKLKEAPWMNKSLLTSDHKQLLPHINGLRFITKPPTYIEEQMKKLNMEGENSLHHSNSSNNSSPNLSPPNTPTIAPHGPGRGDATKSRVNGVPPYACDGQPQQSLPPFSTVPSFTSYQTFTSIPNRSMFYNQPHYRPPFSPHFPTTAENSFNPPSAYSLFPFPYSSPQFTQPPRTPNCYNCGASGHLGQDCTGQNIEEIIQQNAYHLEFASPPLPPDTDK